MRGRMDTYDIVTDGIGGYQVQVTRADGGLGFLTTSFPTYRAAQDWIDDQKQLLRTQQGAAQQSHGPNH